MRKCSGRLGLLERLQSECVGATADSLGVSEDGSFQGGRFGGLARLKEGSFICSFCGEGV